MTTGIRTGIDIGSTTAKAVVLDDSGKTLFSCYRRHNARIADTLESIFNNMFSELGNIKTSVAITGSIGMGVAQRCGIGFVQEVVAETKAIRHSGNTVKTLIDIGGEDAKVVFFGPDGKASDLRMNGNCAGGTGAFIEQMALILGESTDSLNTLALESDRIYPIASRCGVFCKTDIQNLIARNVSKQDISASIFHAVAVQTIVTLAHGCRIEAPIVFSGGPLTFIPALGNAFRNYLKLTDSDIVDMPGRELLSAMGTALAAESEPMDISQWMVRIRDGLSSGYVRKTGLEPLFKDREDLDSWLSKLDAYSIPRGELQPGNQNYFIGIDSGSTTTKIVILDTDGRLVYSFYHGNEGNPVETVRNGLDGFMELCRVHGTEPAINSGCSTGYGEDLIKTAFRLDYGIIETIAHYTAAAKTDPEVSFILDIGGQDMKAIYVDHGIINRIEINEACSSGCGSFIETFARSLGFTVADFAGMACLAAHPCDLGTRCTVFMNSKVKEVLREGYEAPDIAAGLAYSVIRNCLYKVLKITDISALGKHIIVQGGTMKNNSVVKALENMSGAKVSRSDCPELMGAYGCAIYAMEHCITESESEQKYEKAV